MNRNQKTHLITVTVAVEASDLEPETGISELDQFKRRLISAISDTLQLPPPLGWQAIWSIELEPQEVNCGQCVVCKAWVTDREQPEPIEGLDNGARVKGQLLCSEHLPPGHPYAF